MDGPGKLSHEDYTVGWICPLEVEQVAAIEMLDEEHEQLPQSANDHNVYTLGSINGHNVVIAGLPSTGNNPAATVVTQMRNTFRELRFGLLVGIGGGVPAVRLGDVVVSKPTGEHSGAVQYDHGRAEAGQFDRTGFLAPPPTVLLNAAQHLAVCCARSRTDPLLEHLRRIDTTIRGLRRYKYPGADKDHLYRADYVHPEPKVSCQRCRCDPSQQVDRRKDDSDDEEEENEEAIVVHRGTIATGELVIKDGLLRDKLAEQCGILCFEMEAAGALSDFPCLVVRGISDYSDSHKNKKWHGYAAATAAAYARQLFFHMPVDEVKKCGIAERDVQQLIVNSNALVRNNRDENINKWLNPPDPSSNYNDALKKRQTGSGRWLLTTPMYNQWKNIPKSLLWMHGIPGCGKTVLSASVLEDLSGAEKPSCPVLYFYFDFKDRAKQSFDGMLRSLIAQLHQLSEAAQKHLCSAYCVHSDGCQQPSTHTLVEIFWDMIKEAKDVRIVLDALDECENRTEFLPWVGSISKLGENLHVLMTSRKEEDIASSLNQWILPRNIIHIQARLINDDIQEYVRSRIRTGENLKRWRSTGDVQLLIETKLMEKAGGMFRWAACQLDVLGECITLPMLQGALETLPASLEETYHRILANIPKIYHRDCIRILQLITYSERPLYIEDLVDAIAVEVDHEPPFNHKNRMPTPMEISRLCSSLVLVMPSSRELVKFPSIPTRTAKQERWMVQLAHFSVKEYLTSSFSGQLEEHTARAAIVELSLAYLSCVEDQENYSYAEDSYPFFWHSMNWMDHAKIAESSNKHVANSISRFISKGRLHWLWVLWQDDNLMLTVKFKGKPIPNIRVPPLYWPSRTGLVHSVRRLIEEGADVNGNGLDRYPYYYQPLHDAYRNGHNDIVRLLLDNGADIDARGEPYHSTLMFTALVEDDEDFALELLEKGTDPNCTGYVGGRINHSALQQAASQGSTKIVRALVEKGADINWQCMENGTALAFAVKERREAVVQLLLERGCDIHAGGGYGYDSPLTAACSNGHEAVVRLFIDNGADVNASKGIWDNALISASGKGKTAVVKILLESGAYIDADPLGSGSALVKATSNYHSDTVRLLLENGADTNTRDKNGRRPLECFFSGRLPAYDESIPLLLAQNLANLDCHNLRDDFLLLSCQKNYPGCVQLLLEKGANMEATARSSHHFFDDEIDAHTVHREIRLVTEGGYKDDKSNDEENNDEDGEEDEIKDETEDGGEIEDNIEYDEHGEVSGSEDECEKESDIKHGFDDVIEFEIGGKPEYLSKRVRVSEKGNHYGNALHIASSRGFVDIVTLLLARGADPSRLDWHGWTPALIASRYGHSQIPSQSGSIERPCKSSCLPPSKFTNSMFLDRIYSNLITSPEEKAWWANHPFPEDLLLPYFELKIISKPQFLNFLAIGVCSEDYPDPLKGSGNSKFQSWTYSYDGSISTAEDESVESWGPEFDVGDVIGCGVDYEANMIFYCRNKQFLGRAFNVPVGRLFPMLILDIHHPARVSVNLNATVPTGENRKIPS